MPDDVLAAIDAKSKHLGISRAEYLRRALARERTTGDVSVEDLVRFADTFGDLRNDEIMDRAWE